MISSHRTLTNRKRMKEKGKKERKRKKNLKREKNHFSRVWTSVWVQNGFSNKEGESQCFDGSSVSSFSFCGNLVLDLKCPWLTQCQLLSLLSEGRIGPIPRWQATVSKRYHPSFPSLSLHRRLHPFFNTLLHKSWTTKTERWVTGSITIEYFECVTGSITIEYSVLWLRDRFNSC